MDESNLSQGRGDVAADTECHQKKPSPPGHRLTKTKENEKKRQTQADAHQAGNPNPRPCKFATGYRCHPPPADSFSNAIPNKKRKKNPRRPFCFPLVQRQNGPTT
ncbi:hypothetical protein RUM44_010195 [Polyplax serrata]|uniref:Uncharacterized protein n=1 Tax=Polyplax serrata TaxID=468196 RepID=A0ABR1AUW1_POLSC